MKQFNRKAAAAAVALTALLTACGGGNASSASDIIDMGAARTAAFEAAGIQSAEESRITLEQRDGTDYYKVTFSADGKYYEYAIDAMTGVVIEEKISQEGPGESEKPAGAGETGAGETDAETTGAGETGAETDGAGKSGSEPAGQAEPSKKAADGSVISEETAKAAVLERVPGASADQIRMKLEEDDGRQEYEGSLIFDGIEYEFQLDAYSGAIIEWEAEPAEIW